MLDDMTQQNASKVAIFLEYVNSHGFFISCDFIFSLMNALVRDNFFTLISKYLLLAPWIEYLEHLEDFYPIRFFFD